VDIKVNNISLAIEEFQRAHNLHLTDEVEMETINNERAVFNLQIT